MQGLNQLVKQYSSQHVHVIELLNVTRLILQDIASGGAGYVMSREALKRLGSRQQGLCHESRGDEDVEIAECLKRLGVEFGESRDALGRNRFLCFDPEREIHGEFPPWYYKMDKYGAKKVVNDF